MTPFPVSLRCPCAALAVALLLGACAAPEVKPPPAPTPTPAPIDPRIVLLAKANKSFDLGVKDYDGGSFDDSVKNLQDALDIGVLALEKQLDARKLMAFSHCLQKRVPLCRAEFRKMLEIAPTYQLKPAEAGHPDWGTVFRTERDRVLADIVEERRRQDLARLAPAERLLAEAQFKYEAAEFAAALKLFQEAIKEGLTAREDRIRAHKLSAFSHCVENRSRDCRAEFAKALEIDADFDLTPAESGHPSWGRVFTQTKREVKAAQARAASTKGKAAPGKPDGKTDATKPTPPEPKADATKPASPTGAKPVVKPAGPNPSVTTVPAKSP
jgi:tetratricopeptide (TPR) repeat protein